MRAYDEGPSVIAGQEVLGVWMMGICERGREPEYLAQDEWRGMGVWRLWLFVIKLGISE